MSEREGGRRRRPPDLRPIVLVSSPIGYIRASASTRNPVRHRAARHGVKASLAGSSTKAIQSGPGIGCRRGNHRAAFGVAALDRLATAGDRRSLQIPPKELPAAQLPASSRPKAWLQPPTGLRWKSTHSSVTAFAEPKPLLAGDHL
jgi:hypothetical protein